MHATDLNNAELFPLLEALYGHQMREEVGILCDSSRYSYSTSQSLQDGPKVCLTTEPLRYLGRLREVLVAAASILITRG